MKSGGAPPGQAGVPDVTGKGTGAAEAMVRAAGFTPQLAGQIDSSFTTGTVAAASLGVDNQTVYLYTSTGHGGFSAPARHHGGRGHGNGNGNGNGRGNNGNDHPGNGNNGRGNRNGRG